MYRLTNGRIITPEKILKGFDLIIAHGDIVDIALTDEIEDKDKMETIDCDGGFIMPGFIDIHSDYIEHIAAPRPTSMMKFPLALHEAERELLTHGITTMFHSLSLYKSQMFDTKPIRQPENVDKIVSLIHGSHVSKHLIRHRFHARYEIDNLDMVDQLRRYIEEDKIHLVSFMDHTPGQGQYRDLEIFRHTLKGYRKMSDAEVDVAIMEQQAAEKITLDTIGELTKMALDRGIAVASHDDDTTGKIDLIQSFGTTISEFPITMETARYAHEKGMHTVAGAPNVLLGGSHSGNLSAAEAVVDGSVNILCSDYYPAALLHAVFQLHEEYGLSLVDMVNLVTLNPAKAVNMDETIGSLERGKKADILVVERLEDQFPAVTNAFVDGKPVLTTTYRR
ncbi:MAG: phosphonate metabolism protein PhnM [Spirochaetales bacterium]|nr:phosphonate metabolism protein PhnM [Spirochaetales bacterium]